MNEIEFLKKFSDYQAADAWRKSRLADSVSPPAAFLCGAKSSRCIAWKKTDLGKTEYIDYPNTGPRRRLEQKFRYEAEDLETVVTCTSYPDYPIVEFQSRLKNTSTQNSPVIKDLMAVDDIIAGAHENTLHYNRGSRTKIDDFQPLTRQLIPGKIHTVSVDTGKPTSLMLPNFNIEAENGGVIAVMSWQGCWKSDFSQGEGGLRMTAGQYETEFVLFPGEEYRTPLMVLLFYKGGFADGQNIWRRWWYNHNLLRKQGVRIGKNAITCIGDAQEGMMGNAADDKAHIDDLAAAGMETVIDYFVQDAGWYDCKAGGGWQYTGNWYPPSDRYPNGIREVSDYARAHGIKYAMWIEPERIREGTEAAKNLGDKVMAYEHVEGAGPRWLPPERRTPVMTNLLVNYALPEVVDSVIDMIDGIITTYGLDMYRQDFNIDPAPFWRAEEEHLKERLGVPRLGVVEEKYTAGYLRLFSTLVDRHPGMIIDGCAGGGTRGDLESMRMAFLHTRSDQWADVVGCQNLTYGAAMWYVIMGGGSPDFTDPYDRRSRLVTSIGTAMNQESFPEIKKAFKEWENTIKHMMFDYYPLSEYDPENKGVMAMQFNDPDRGEGLVAVYIRKETDHALFVAKPENLDENTVYKLHMIETPDDVMKMTGRQLMDEGIVVDTTTKEHACLYFYSRAYGCL